MFTSKQNQEGSTRTEVRRSPREGVETRRPFVAPQLVHEESLSAVTHDDWDFTSS